MKEEKFLVTILSLDKKGLVGHISQILNRRLIHIVSISASRTDVYDNVIITVEIVAVKSDIKNLLAKFQNIIEVVNAMAVPLSDAWYSKVAVYALDRGSFNSRLFNKVQRHGASLLGTIGERLVIQKIGRDEDITSFLAAVEGIGLKCVYRTAPISLDIIQDGGDQSSVISGLPMAA